MHTKLEKTELIFKIISYLLLTVFAVCCVYPFIYTLSAALSGKTAYIAGEVILWPKQVQFSAFRYIFDGTYGAGQFWVSYANTLFITFFGTIWAISLSIMGAYALSKPRIAFRRALNFYLVFTMWFTAGMMPMWLNYQATIEIFDKIGIQDQKWTIVIAMGMNAFNVVLLRNTFEGVPKEIEEAAIVDGANDFQLLWRVYVPMSKATIATVTLFFGVSRWNGYFWAKMVMDNPKEVPLQVYIRDTIDELLKAQDVPDVSDDGVFANESLIYAMVICAIVPIIVIYPYIQKYFAKGVNLGGVKE